MKARHLTDKEIEMYVDTEYLGMADSDPESGRLSMEKVQAIEEHILECEQCALKVKKVMDFSISFDEWMNTSLTPVQKTVLKGLKEMNPADSGLKSRVMAWIRNFGQSANASVKVFFNTAMNGASNITKLTGDKLDNLLNRGNVSFQHPVVELTTRRGGGKGSVIRKKLGNQLYVMARDERTAEIKADPKEQKIVVSILSGRFEEPPIIFLIPTDFSDKPAMKIPVIVDDKRRSDTNKQEKEMIHEKVRMEAVFEAVDPGKYVLAIEPGKM